MGWNAGGSVGDRIRQRRRAIGFTQRQLADAAGVSVGMVRDLEQGITTRPRTSSVDRLTAALGLDGGPPARPPEGLAIGVLGPLVGTRRGSPVPLGYGRSRAILGLLAPVTFRGCPTVAAQAGWASGVPFVGAAGGAEGGVLPAGVAPAGPASGPTATSAPNTAVAAPIVNPLRI